MTEKTPEHIKKLMDRIKELTTEIEKCFPIQAMEKINKQPENVK